MHKRHCQQEDFNSGPLSVCQDCGAKFCSSKELKDHIASHAGDLDTQVCPLHCGQAFSSQSCLEQHMVKCLKEQKMGPYKSVQVTGWREFGDQILEVASDAGF